MRVYFALLPNGSRLVGISKSKKRFKVYAVFFYSRIECTRTANFKSKQP